MKRTVLIIIVVSSLDIGFDVIVIDGAALLLFSCFCFIIGQRAFNLTSDTVMVASKRRC